MAAGAGLAGLVGTLGIFVTLVVIVIVTWLGTKIGKKNAFFVSTGISMIGYALKWVCYTPDYPMLALLPAPFLAFGLGGLFTLMGSMIADVLYSTGLEPALGANQPEGTIFWLRFYDAFVPLVASAIAIVVIYRYPITEQSALEVRAELERRRGT